MTIAVIIILTCISVAQSVWLVKKQRAETGKCKKCLKSREIEWNRNDRELEPQRLQIQFMGSKHSVFNAPYYDGSYLGIYSRQIQTRCIDCPKHHECECSSECPKCAKTGCVHPNGTCSGRFSL